MLFYKSATALFLAGALTGAQAQTGEINLLTDLGTPFPPGCLSINLPEQPRSEDSLLVDTTISAPTINSEVRDGSVELQIWRVACDDEGFSVVLVRMRDVGGINPIVVPQVFADSGDVDFPGHKAQLLRLPGSGDVGASGDIITTAGTTWMLGVDPFPLDPDDTTDFVPDDYNSPFTVEFNWGSYSIAQPEETVFLLDGFDPALDPPQFDQPVLNGRFSGQWVREGAPRQGLFLTVAEQIDSNFVFAIFFTYLDGQPFWMTGNTAPALAEPGPVSIPMFTLENGAFITDSSQPPADQVLASDVGSIEIVVIDCNRLRVNYNFSPIGKGTGFMILDRIARIAGYDCNPWQ